MYIDGVQNAFSTELKAPDLSAVSVYTQLPFPHNDVIVIILIFYKFKFIKHITVSFYLQKNRINAKLYMHDLIIPSPGRRSHYGQV